MPTDRRGLDYSNLLCTHPPTGPQVSYDTPRRALVTAPTYTGAVVTLEVDVIARSRGLLCVEQHDPDWGVWRAWVPAECCEPMSR